jgi:acyl carrier protein
MWPGRGHCRQHSVSSMPNSASESLGVLGLDEFGRVCYSTRRLLIGSINALERPIVMEKSIASILEEILELKPKTLRDNDILSSLNLDSMDTINLIADVDSVFGVTISPTNLADCRRIEDLANLIEDRRQRRSSAA